MLDLNSIAIGSAKPKALAKFYEKVFKRAADWEEGDWHGWQVGSTFIHIGPHSEVKGKAKEPQRVIFNFETKQVKRDFTRIKDLGAKVIKEPYDYGRHAASHFRRPRWQLLSADVSLEVK